MKLNRFGLGRSTRAARGTLSFELNSYSKAMIEDVSEDTHSTTHRAGEKELTEDAEMKGRDNVSCQAR